MTDREIVEDILKRYNKGKWPYIMNYCMQYDLARFTDYGKCTYLDLRYEELKKIPNGIYKLKHLEWLDLRNSTIKEIPKSLYDSIKFVILDNIVSIINDTKSTKYMMSDKQTVDAITKICKGNWQHTLKNFIDNEYVIFNDLDQCTYLDLSFERLTEIPNELYNLNHLDHLDLRNNDIKKIPNSLIDKVDNILYDPIITTNPKEVKMTDRQIVKNILKKCKSWYAAALKNFINNKYVIFNNKGQCTHLDLSSEGLKEIPEEVYKLKHLKHLDLRFNSIKEIPKSLHDSIDEVLIDDTKPTVSTIDDSKLKELKMTDKEIVENLLMICLGNVWRYSIKNFIDNKYVKFNDNGQCISLNLQSKVLTHIPKELYKLKHLEYLALNNNNIGEIPKSLYDSIATVLIDDTVTIIDDSTKPSIFKKIDKIMNSTENVIDKIKKYVNELNKNTEKLSLKIYNQSSNYLIFNIADIKCDNSVQYSITFYQVSDTVIKCYIDGAEDITVKSPIELINELLISPKTIEFLKLINY